MVVVVAWPKTWVGLVCWGQSGQTCKQLAWMHNVLVKVLGGSDWPLRSSAIAVNGVRVCGCVGVCVCAILRLHAIVSNNEDCTISSPLSDVAQVFLTSSSEQTGTSNKSMGASLQMNLLVLPRKQSSDSNATPPKPY